MELEDFRVKKSVILDTCLIIYEIKQMQDAKLIEFCEKNNVIITSFTLQELKKVTKKLGHEKKNIRKFLENAKITIVNVPVSPGEIKKEKKYTENDLLQKIHDPSDAVLVTAAIKSRSDIITRDKHHLFTTKLEQELQEYGLKIYNDLSKYES